MARLPELAFFAQGQGPPGDQLREALAEAGFEDVLGGGDKIFVLSVTPPGGAKEQISPPGNDPKREFDVASVITLLGGTIKKQGDKKPPFKEMGTKPD